MRSGFTLVEMIVVIVIMAVVGVIGVVALKEGVEIYAASSRDKEVCEAARFALDRMVREIRELDESSVTRATSAEMSFTDPYNTALTRRENVVTFRLSGSTIERSGDGGASWEPLAENVTCSGIFAYYKIQSGSAVSFTPSAPYADIRWVLVSLEVGGPEARMVLRQQVCLARGRR